MANLLKKAMHPGSSSKNNQAQQPGSQPEVGQPAPAQAVYPPTSSKMSMVGKVVLITGSSRNIGAAIARRFAAEGADVVINYAKNEQAARETADGINKLGAGRAFPIQSDVSSVASAKKLVEDTIAEFGRIDVLVLNAGIMGAKTLLDVDEEYYDQHFNINVKGPFFVTQFAVPHMPSGSRIIFFSTHLTIQSVITPNYVVYAGTKGAVEQFSRVLAKDLGSRGINVNTVSPGPTATSLFFAGKTEEQIKKFEGFSPFGRLGQPDEIAAAVLYLAGPDANWVSGTNLLVAGGATV